MASICSQSITDGHSRNVIDYGEDEQTRMGILRQLS